MSQKLDKFQTYNQISANAFSWLLSNIYISSVTHDDFGDDGLTFIVDSPSYVPSPYGAWLAISNNPRNDSFSNWFRFAQNINYEFNDTVTLEGISFEGTHRYDKKSAI